MSAVFFNAAFWDGKFRCGTENLYTSLFLNGNNFTLSAMGGKFKAIPH
jgi:hypothetical protein